MRPFRLATCGFPFLKLVDCLSKAADRFQIQQVPNKKGRNLSILQGPLDGAKSNRHPAYMHDATNGVETYQTGLSICSKNCPDFLVKMNYLSAPGIFPPGSTTKIEIIRRGQKTLPHK